MGFVGRLLEYVPVFDCEAKINLLVRVRRRYVYEHLVIATSRSDGHAGSKDRRAIFRIGRLAEASPSHVNVERRSLSAVSDCYRNSPLAREGIRCGQFDASDRDPSPLVETGIVSSQDDAVSGSVSCSPSGAGLEDARGEQSDGDNECREFSESLPRSNVGSMRRWNISHRRLFRGSVSTGR